MKTGALASFRRTYVRIWRPRQGAIRASRGVMAAPQRWRIVIERLDDSFAKVDPQEAHRAALDSGIVVHRAAPLNGEAPLEALGNELTPNARFYVRNHFGIPKLEPASWRLRVNGLVDNPLSLSLSDLLSMPALERVATVECAGNGRATLEPRVEGEQWRFGAVSAARWTGVPLVEVLDRAAVTAQAC